MSINLTFQPSSLTFSKFGVQFLDHDLESVLHPITMEDKAIWVPQAPIQSSHIPLGLTQTSALDVAAQGC